MDARAYRNAHAHPNSDAGSDADVYANQHVHGNANHPGRDPGADIVSCAVGWRQQQHGLDGLLDLSVWRLCLVRNYLLRNG